MIEVFIPGQPPTATAQQKGQNRKTGAYYKTPELRNAESKYMAWLAKSKPEKPLDGAVVLTVQFGFQPSNLHPHGTPKTTKPDTDNMVKLLKDCMTKCGYWHDDAQVAMETVVKIYHEAPGILVEVMTWEEAMSSE